MGSVHRLRLVTVVLSGLYLLVAIMGCSSGTSPSDESNNEAASEQASEPQRSLQVSCERNPISGGGDDAILAAAILGIKRAYECDATLTTDEDNPTVSDRDLEDAARRAIDSVRLPDAIRISYQIGSGYSRDRKELIVTDLDASLGWVLEDALYEEYGSEVRIVGDVGGIEVILVDE